MEYITSDLHFGHKNILEFCSDTRPFDDIRHMNDELIKQWNRTVGENDTIYHLGDFCFKGQDFTDNTLKQLNGNKVFILGNHDKHTKDVLSKHGQVYDYLYLKRKNASNVVMFHYPILQWDGKERGVPHLYGHCHGTCYRDERCIDVGYDANESRILTLDEAVNLAKQKNRGEPRRSTNDTTF